MRPTRSKPVVLKNLPSMISITGNDVFFCVLMAIGDFAQLSSNFRLSVEVISSFC